MKTLIPSGQADETRKNDSRMINVLGVAMLLNTLNTPALTRSSERFYLQDKGCHGLMTYVDLT